MKKILSSITIAGLVFALSTTIFASTDTKVTEILKKDNSNYIQKDTNEEINISEIFDTARKINLEKCEKQIKDAQEQLREKFKKETLNNLQNNIIKPKITTEYEKLEEACQTFQEEIAESTKNKQKETNDKIAEVVEVEEVLKKLNHRKTKTR